MRRNQIVTLRLDHFQYAYATAMDRSPVSIDPSPYAIPPEGKSQMGFDVTGSHSSDSSINNLLEESTLDNVRRWQATRLKSKSAREIAQHAVNFSERTRLMGFDVNTKTDRMLADNELRREMISKESREDFKILEQVRQEREGSTQSVFRPKMDIDAVVNFPQRVADAEKAAYESIRHKELSLALKQMPLNSSVEGTKIAFDVGNLRVVKLETSKNLNEATRAIKSASFQPSRRVVKQLSELIPASKPFTVSGEQTSNGVFRQSSNEGALIPSCEPSVTHSIQANPYSRFAAKSFESGSVLTEEEMLSNIQREDDILLRSHSHFTSELRHPQATNMNRSEVHHTQTPIIKAAIEGEMSDLPTEDPSLTPLQRQRYLDVLETQRQADIAMALSKLKTFEQEAMAKKSDKNHLHRKFSIDNRAEMNSQHEYLQKLLLKENSTTQGLSSTRNDGIQWIGTTPEKFQSKMNSFFIRVSGSAVFLGILFWVNPTLLDPQ